MDKRAPRRTDTTFGPRSCSICCRQRSMPRKGVKAANLHANRLHASVVVIAIDPSGEAVPSSDHQPQALSCESCHEQPLTTGETIDYLNPDRPGQGSPPNRSGIGCTRNDAASISDEQRPCLVNHPGTQTATFAAPHAWKSPAPNNTPISRARHNPNFRSTRWFPGMTSLCRYPLVPQLRSA